MLNLDLSFFSKGYSSVGLEVGRKVPLPHVLPQYESRVDIVHSVPACPYYGVPHDSEAVTSSINSLTWTPVIELS